MSLTALCNGAWVSEIDPADRGLHYGDGVFRTIRVAGGRAIGWPTHWQRLAHDCSRLGLPVLDRKLLAQEAQRLFADGGDGVLKILITRGAGGRGYAPPVDPDTNRLLFRYPLPAWPAEYPREGVAIGVSGTPLGCNPALAGVKHCNRLEQVLARRECSERGWPEALMQTADGRVICGTMSNLFVSQEGRLWTPQLVDAGVAGATRQRLLALWRHAGGVCEQAALTLEAIRAADELFLCNSLMEVWPVRAIGEQRFAVGEISRWCQRQLQGAACCGW